ncbi:hypothetical protein FHT70_001132 [Rhizobium sp. BK049]|nr:hypothetical protein [Rhizobium sp. BK049]
MGCKQKRLAESFRANFAGNCIDTGFYGSDVFLAVIRRPIVDQEMCRIAERPDDLACCRTAQSKRDRRECP